MISFYVKYKMIKIVIDKIEHDRIRWNTKKLIKKSKRNFEAHIANISKSNPK